MKLLRFRTSAVFATLLSLLAAAGAEQPAPLRVFVCAHSFMIFTSKLLPSMAQAAGFPYTSAGQQMIGGSRVLQHWNLPDEKNVAKTALREGRVDVLTLSPHRQLPDEGIDNFTRLTASGLDDCTAAQAAWAPAGPRWPKSPRANAHKRRFLRRRLAGGG